MSTIFDPQTNPDTPSQTQTTQTQESYVGQLVKARGEQWSDPEVIAKGKLEADAYVQQLEAQAAEMREEIAKQDYAADLLKQLQTKDTGTTTAQPASQPSASGTNPDDTSQTVSEDVIKGLVEQTITERERQNTVSQNLTEVQNKLKDLHGDQGNNVVKEKAEELGMSLERMQEMAGTSPKAFFQLLGEAPQQQRDFTKSTIRSDSVNTEINSGLRDSAYYTKLRRENKSKYFSVAVQNQMIQDRMELGDRF